MQRIYLEGGAMRIKIAGQEEGSIPSETMVTIATAAGPEMVTVHGSQVHGGSVEAGYIGRREDQILIELPRETESGRWRIWVPSSAIA
jgi:hypothetical protein